MLEYESSRGHRGVLADTVFKKKRKTFSSAAPQCGE